MSCLFRKSQKQISEYQTTADISKISEKMARLILAQADSYIDQLWISIQSIANRATGLVGVYSTGATISLASAWTLSGGLDDVTSPFFSMLLIFALLWITAAILCAIILRPRPTPPKGSEPANWLDHPELVEGKIVVALVGVAERYQDRIPTVSERIKIDARLLRWAIGLGIAGPLAISLSFFVRLL